MILAGGLGTRLRRAFDAGPKSLAPVGKKVFLDYLLTWLGAEGVKEAILCVGYKGAQIQEHVGGGEAWGVRARYSVETRLLGTGGALKQAEGMIREDCVFVVNGDTYLGVSLREMLEFHRQRKASVTVAVARVEETGRYGSVHLDEEKRITVFQEKSGTRFSGETAGMRSINGGVYVVRREVLEMIPVGREMSLEKEVLPDLVACKGIFGFETNGYFLDIGVEDDFSRAQTELPERFHTSHSD